MERMLIANYGDPGPLASRAVDASVCVADGRVLVTPIDSDSLHCLNLIDGELRWKYKRQDDLYTACVYQGKVILVGRHQVQAIRLADGNPGWEGHVISLSRRRHAQRPRIFHRRPLFPAAGFRRSGRD